MMKYISGKYALNLPDKKMNCDWHQHYLDWNNPCIHDSVDYPFEDWGIELRHDVPEVGTAYVANHARACLELLHDGKYGTAGGMRDNYINGTIHIKDIFVQVVKMRSLKNWDRIDRFMKKEYKLTWVTFKKRNEIQ